jgi:hypothetical protein
MTIIKQGSWDLSIEQLLWSKHVCRHLQTASCATPRTTALVYQPYHDLPITNYLIPCINTNGDRAKFSVNAELVYVFV